MSVNMRVTVPSSAVTRRSSRRSCCAHVERAPRESRMARLPRSRPVRTAMVASSEPVRVPSLPSDAVLPSGPDDYSYVSALQIEHRLVISWKLVGLHQVDASQEFIRGVDAVEMLTRNVHELRESGAGADVDCVVTFFSDEFIDGHGSTYDHISLELDSHLAHVVELLVDDLFGQAEFGNAIDEHTAEFMERFKNTNLVTLLDEIAGNGETRGTAAYDGELLPCGGNVGYYVSPHTLFIVGDEAFQITDAEGLHLLR